MGMMPYKEYDLSEKIKNGEEDFFVVSSKDIKRVMISGYDNDLRFVSGSISDLVDEVIVLEVLNDNGKYYFKPIFSDDYISILGEDYYFGESPELDLGEVRLSSNRINEIMRGRQYFVSLDNMDYTPVAENKDFIIENPLGVYLTSLVPISALPNNGSRMVHYNVTFADDLKHKIGRMKFDAQTNLIRQYDLLLGNNKKYTK